MKENRLFQTTTILINLTLVGLMAYFIKETNSDKSPMIFMVLYPILILLNLVLLILFWLLKKHAIDKILKDNIIILLMLILPMIIFISSI